LVLRIDRLKAYKKSRTWVAICHFLFQWGFAISIDQPTL
jgi:hypothetical protein